MANNHNDIKLPKLEARHVIAGTLIVSAPRYMAAFIISDAGQLTGAISTLATVLIGASGVGLGLVEVAGTSVIIDGWKRRFPNAGKKASKPFKFLTAILLATCGLSLVILTPYTVSRLQGGGIAETVGWFGWIWSLAVNLDPFVILAGVAYCQKGTVSKPVMAKTSPVMTEYKPINDKPVTKAEFMQTVSLHAMTADEIAKKCHVHVRTAARWLSELKKGKGEG